MARVANNTPAVSASTNRLTGGTYDASGNLLQLGPTGTQHTFDVLDEMRQRQDGPTTWQYLYTADGERVIERNPATGLMRWTLRGPGNQPLRILEDRGPGQWTLLRDYIYAGGRLVASVGTEGPRHYHLDHLGSVRLETDANGAVVKQRNFLPFGEELTTAASENELRFTGHERDDVVANTSADDLDYMHARFCSPTTGRFLSVDPSRRSARADRPQTWNRYLYTVGNPLVLVDLNGKWPTHVKHVHQNSIDRVLSHLPASDRAILRKQQVIMDFDQTTAGSFKHAMRSAGRETVEEARAKANQFIRKNLETARRAEAEGKHDLAVALVGRAMHTVQDSTSPEHSGFQPWDQAWGALDGRVLGHVTGEFYDPGALSALDAATERIWQLFSNPEASLDGDFFEVTVTFPHCTASQGSCQ